MCSISIDPGMLMENWEHCVWMLTQWKQPAKDTAQKTLMAIHVDVHRLHTATLGRGWSHKPSTSICVTQNISHVTQNTTYCYCYETLCQALLWGKCNKINLPQATALCNVCAMAITIYPRVDSSLIRRVDFIYPWSLHDIATSPPSEPAVCKYGDSSLQPFMINPLSVIMPH